MEFFQDISNKNPAHRPILKTFERKHKAAGNAEPSTPCSRTPGSGTGTSAAGVEDEGAPHESRDLSCATSNTRRTTKHGRRSSVLRAAALPGHHLFSSQTSISRSLLLAKMSNAQRKTFMSYTRRMAEYYAEVDQFELVVESPEATQRQARNKLKPTATAACPAVEAAVRLQTSPEVPSAQTRAGWKDAAPRTAQHDLQHKDLQGVASSDCQTVPTPQQVHVLAPAETYDFSGTAAAPPASVTSERCSREPVLYEHTSSTTKMDFSALQTSSLSCGMAGLSLTADLTALMSSTPSGPSDCVHDAAAAPAELPVELLAQGEAKGLLCSSPAKHTPLKQQMVSSSIATLEAVTSDNKQQADMQQLMQHMWHAAASAKLCGDERSLSASRQQQQQAHAGLKAGQELSVDLAADIPLAVPSDQQVQQRHCGGLIKTATAAAHPDVIAADAAVDALQQQLEQQQLADQHYQVWLQKQAEAAATVAAATELQHLELEASVAAELTPLQQMLQACKQSVVVGAVPTMSTFLEDVVDLRDVVKIGEGTYGEAFKSGQVVLKLVPMEGSNLINGWPQKGAGDLLAEAVIALTLSDLSQEHDKEGALHASYTDAFVQTHRVGVCRGPYPAAFIKAWKAWDKRHKSENEPIAGLPADQLYAVFAMANCGRDLESYQLQGFEQARSLLLQTVLALAVAEETLAFEHRDLHWGNIMLSPPHSTHITARLKGCNIKIKTQGARVRLIDFTASRLQTPGGDVVFCDLEAEDGIFDGPKGHPQFETYRRMRKLTNSNWTGSYPGTNVLWVLYLVELLLSSEKPIPGATAAQKRNMREFKKRLSRYQCCSDIIWDELFEGLWAVV